MNREKYEKIVSILCNDASLRKFYYKDFLIERSDTEDLYYVNHYILEYHEFISTLIMIDILVSDSFTKRCFEKQEVPFIHSEIFRDGF